MTLHVVSMPHTQTTTDYNLCAYTIKTIKFCTMMKDLGYTVYLYASEDNQAPCDELITCISKQEQADILRYTHYVHAPFEPTHKLWTTFNNRAIKEIEKRKQPKDFLCVIAGYCQKTISDAHPDLMTVEWGVGYGGVYSNYRVFESYAWMHTVYGSLYGTHSADGRFYDTVIPNFFEVDKFPFSDIKEDYYLFIGRIIERKGYHIAQEACQRAGKRLIVAGLGDFSGYGEYIGPVDEIKRGELMSKAKAVFAPTIYVEPFGAVVPEAQLCGTPTITTDWGAFTETVEQGKTGMRCRTLKEFTQAIDRDYDYNYIREQAVSRWSMDVLKLKYKEYFENLSTLWDEGWYSS
jgi:glycosyltransferase involved in cell wall biosynthesis